MIQIKVVFEVASAERASFNAAMREAMRTSQRESGCLYYRFTADLDVDTRFYLLEEWASEEALRTHYKTSGFAAFAQRLGQLEVRRTTDARTGDLIAYQLSRPTNDA